MLLMRQYPKLSQHLQHSSGTCKRQQALHTYDVFVGLLLPGLLQLKLVQ
jgi:hypothetical protein